MARGLAIATALCLSLAARAEAGDAQPAQQTEPPAQKAEPPGEHWSLDLTIHDFGIGIGHSKHVDGLRLNFRDVAPFTVHGINLTVWVPEEHEKGAGVGDVTGLALGVPATGARTLRGVGLGAGVAVEKSLDGVGVGVLGIGSGESLHGIFAGGLGLGAGGDVDGIAIGGLGIGAGGSARGIFVGGLGAGVGGDLTGLAIGGLGIGVGGNARGVFIGGLGAGAGGNVEGIAMGLLGVGAGGHVRGIVLAGLGVGAGSSVDGLAVAGLGVGSPKIRGVVAALMAGGEEVTGVAIAPAYFYVKENGSFTGVSLSAFNRILGEQHGVVIGIFNYTPSLHGVQLGLLNWAGNNPSGLKLLPVANAHFD